MSDKSILAGILETPTVWLQLDSGVPRRLSAPFSGTEKIIGRDAEAKPLSAHARLPLETRLRIAFEQGLFALAYQPSIDARTGRIRGAEALLRWQDPLGEASAPSTFVPALEASGLILPVGEWVLREACARFAQGDPALTVSVNLAPRQFAQPWLVERIAEVLRDTRLPPQRLELEVTESVLENVEHAVHSIERLNALGVCVLIDDFGVGYSSLGHLKKLPASGLKLDRTFVTGIFTSRRDRLITESIIKLAAELSLEVVAEGVETVEQEQWLWRNGIRRMQGFLYSPAIPFDDFAAMARAQPFRPRKKAAKPLSRASRRSPRRR
ncbi:MAG TPA: EAL domain-containing protein [Nevskiaceae bacterium]|nr:EAL domain-containing protein [Nevskiaceae bacterium]